MEDNRGFSLVELVIVIAIMAVLGAFFFIGNALLAGQYVRECAEDISAALNKEKNFSLTRSATVDCYMELVYDSDDNAYYVRYYQPVNAIATGMDDGGSFKGDDWVLAEEEKVGKGIVRVVCEFDDGSTVVIKNDSVKFVFDRISGAYKKTIVSDGATRGIESDSTVFCTGITIDGSRTYDITIHSATGKHVLTRTK